MSFALDFKSKFPLKTSSSFGFAPRTFGIYSETKAIHEGRHDLTVEVWAVDGELGVGPPRKEEIGADGVAKWRREGARLVGVSTQVRFHITRVYYATLSFQCSSLTILACKQMALSLSIAVNHSRGKTPPTAAGETESTRKQARL